MPHVKFSALNQNLELYYELHGSGKTKILFIMGLLTDGAAWVMQTNFFREQPEYQCVSYDNRGYGRSSTPFTIHYSTTQMAKDALALIDHLEWPQCHVVGMSMGGMIALELALLAPERVLSLTLLATHAGGFSGLVPLPAFCGLVQAFFLNDVHSKIEHQLLRLYGSKAHANPEERKRLYDAHYENFKADIPSSMIGTIGQLLAIQRHYVSYADLLKIRYSPFDCLIIVGTEDRLVREANSYIIRQALGCRLIQLEHAGHGLPGEYPKEINSELFKLYESIRTNNSAKSKREIPKEYKIEIQALEQCCQHRTHCLVYNITGLIKGFVFGMILYMFLAGFDLIKGLLGGIHLTFESVILLGCLCGLRRAITCVYNAFNARRYVREHRLLLDRAAHHGGIGVSLPVEPTNGIPYGCGFEFPVHSIIFIISLIIILYSTRVCVQKTYIFLYPYPE